MTEQSPASQTPDVTTAETPKGPVTTQIVRKWTMSAGELVVDMYIDNPNGSFEAKGFSRRVNRGLHGSIRVIRVNQRPEMS